MAVGSSRKMCSSAACPPRRRSGRSPLGMRATRAAGSSSSTPRGAVSSTRPGLSRRLLHPPRDPLRWRNHRHRRSSLEHPRHRPALRRGPRRLERCRPRRCANHVSDGRGQRIHRYWLILAAIAVVVLAVAVALGFGFVRWITRPLRRIETAAGEVARGNLRRGRRSTARPSCSSSPASSTTWSSSSTRSSAPRTSSSPMRRTSPHAADGAPPPSREPRARGRHEERRSSSRPSSRWSG